MTNGDLAATYTVRKDANIGARARQATATAGRAAARVPAEMITSSVCMKSRPSSSSDCCCPALVMVGRVTQKKPGIWVLGGGALA